MALDPALGLNVRAYPPQTITSALATHMTTTGRFRVVQNFDSAFASRPI
jgi:curli biogenesis system outer membrane secretion channel CsgG